MFKRRSKSGAPVHRHTQEEATTQSSGDPALREAVITHVERQIGPIAWTWKDTDPRCVRVDVHVVAQNENSPGFTLVTSGMSEQDRDGSRRQRSELVMGVHPAWPGMTGDPAEEEWTWPVRLLRDLARLPHRFDTHLAMNHTVPNGDPPSPYASDTRLCGALLGPVLVTPDKFATFRLGDQEIQMLGVFPLHRDEMQYKLDRGANALWDLIDEHEISEALDPGRPSVLKP